MNIKRLFAENVKRLRVVEIKPDGAVVEIAGKNGSGKSSTLDAIFMALAGAGAIPKTPIRKGEESAKIVCDMGELVVTRTFRAAGDAYTTKITVTAADGSTFQRPQEVANALFGTLTFDPLEFSRMKPQEQFDTLRRFVPDVDFKKIDGLNKTDFDKRTEVSRRAREAEASAGMIVIPDGTPDDDVDEAALVKELASVAAHNSDIEVRKNNRALAVDKVKALRADAAKMIAEADAIEARLKEAPELPAPKDAAKIEAAITAARETNKAVAAKRRRAQFKDAADAAKKEAETLTQAIEARNAAKQAAIKAAKMPVDGLSFGSNEVLFKGLPLDQASQAERIRVSCAIAMAGNPKLKVLLIRDGAVLDSDSMELIRSMAVENDFQVWIETINPDNRPAVVLEDGHVKE